MVAASENLKLSEGVVWCMQHFTHSPSVHPATRLTWNTVVIILTPSNQSMSMTGGERTLFYVLPAYKSVLKVQSFDMIC